MFSIVMFPIVTFRIVTFPIMRFPIVTGEWSHDGSRGRDAPPTGINRGIFMSDERGGMMADDGITDTQHPASVGLPELMDRLTEGDEVMERVLDNPIRENKLTEVVCLDQPGAGGACHQYVIRNRETKDVYAVMHFQEGPVREVAKEAGKSGEVLADGVNGMHQEDLLAIVIDRLEHFMLGDYPSEENGEALSSVKEAVFWLNYRTAKRERRGVEGTHKK